MSALSPTGRVIYALAMVGFGVALLRYAGVHIFMVPSQHRFPMNPVFPLPPPLPWLVVLLGVVLAVLGLAMLRDRLRPIAAPVLAVVLVLAALVFSLPRYAAFPASVALRTELLEPFTFAAFAILLARSPAGLIRTARIVVGATMVVYGADHFLLIKPLAGLVPAWLPWHVFWIVFFGLAFIAAGVSIAANFGLKWGAAALGLMFAIFVFTLQVPLAMGWLKIPGQDLPADLWSSCLIAVAMWGGAWGLVASRQFRQRALQRRQRRFALRRQPLGLRQHLVRSVGAKAVVKPQFVLVNSGDGCDTSASSSQLSRNQGIRVDAKPRHELPIWARRHWQIHDSRRDRARAGSNSA